MTGRGPPLTATDPVRSSSNLPKSPQIVREEGRQDDEDRKTDRKTEARSQEEDRRGDSLFSVVLKEITLDDDIQEFTGTKTHRGCREAGQAGRSKLSCEASLLSTLAQKSPGSSICSVETARRSPSAGRRSPSPVGHTGSIMAADTCRCAQLFLGNKKTTEPGATYGGGTRDNKLGGETAADV